MSPSFTGVNNLLLNVKIQREKKMPENKSVRDKKKGTANVLLLFPKYFVNFKYLYNHQQRECHHFVAVVVAAACYRRCQSGGKNIMSLFTTYGCMSVKTFSHCVAVISFPFVVVLFFSGV